MARPQEFDRNEVLKAAMDVFHQQGYGATSVPDLVAATHLQPGSLYGAFKNKKGILTEALCLYADETAAYINRIFASSDTALGGVRKFLLQQTDVCKGESGRYGCLMVNTLLEMAPQDEEIEELLNKHLSRMESRIAKQLQLAKDQGELATDKDPKILAKFVMTSMWGLRVLGKTNPPVAELRAVIEQIVTNLNGCAKPGD